MLRKWLTRARIVLLLLCLTINFQSIKSELFKTGCLLNSDLCDKNEFCHNDNKEGVCLEDLQLGFDDESRPQSTNDDILKNLNNLDNNEQDLNDNLNGKDDPLNALNDNTNFNTNDNTNDNMNDQNDNPSDYQNDEPIDKRNNDDEDEESIKLQKLYNRCISVIKSQNLMPLVFKIFKSKCDKLVDSMKNEPKILLDDNQEINLNDYIQFGQEKNNEQQPNEQPSGSLYQDFVVENDDKQTDEKDENSNHKPINEKLDDAAELLASLSLNYNDRNQIDKKLDQKKPGPLFKNLNGLSFDDYVDPSDPTELDDDKFNSKRFDQSRILSENGFDDLQDDSDSINGIFKRKFDITPSNAPQADHKPVEEGSVHVELDPSHNLKLVEPTSPDEKDSPFVAVDSSYAYIYFLKDTRLNSNNNKSIPPVSNEEELMARDDMLARKYFIDNLQKRMGLPTNSFTELKLENSSSDRLADCVPFSFLKYLIIFYNDEQSCNCKILIASFKVNPNGQQLNASTVADQVEQYKENLETETGLVVIQTGIGSKVKIERKRECKINILHTFINLSLCAVAVIMVVLLVIFYQRKESISQKIYNVACGAPVFVGWFGEKDYTQCTLGNLASKPQKQSKADLEKQALDYQDLCRQRMKAANEQNKKSCLKNTDEMKAVYQASNASPPSIEKAKLQQKSATGTPNDQLISTAMNMDISTGHLILEYMENHLKQNGDKLNREWNALSNLSTDDYPQSQNAAKLAAHKNRYSDDPTTWPFDNSRVILNDLESKDQIDYINASTIIDSDPNPIYIATQGPMKDTTSDFWQAVWENGSSVIVMLTRLIENGVEQSAKYWPEKGSETYLHFEVNLVSEHIWSEQYLVRSLYLKNLLKNETRTVTQFNFLSWSESSVPTSPAPLLEFRRKVNKSYREKSSPIIVHCSDGCNRTGAYILIDIVLNRLTKGVKEIDLSATLEHLRIQRPSMIKNKETFEFCLKAIAEEVHNLLRSLQK